MEQQGAISVKELALQLGCTEMTVRRNLDRLQEEGLIRREHGYAKLIKTAQLSSYDQQHGQNIAEKKAIAAAALKLIDPGMSICLDSGTTTQQLVEMIPDNFPLSVITSSLSAAMTLTARPAVQTLMPGGFIHHRNRSLLIDHADELQRYQSDIAFLACQSFQLPGGTFEYSQTLTHTKRALASVATRRVLLLDYSKWDKRSIFNCIALENIDMIITDKKAPADKVEQARKAGKEILLV
jgi:DeoR/GlpR family transcriptional regulator of sugar metabolism